MPVKVASRVISTPKVSMWGSLYAREGTGALLGWLVDSWTDSVTIEPLLRLRPKMYWIPKEDGKFYFVTLYMDPGPRMIEVREEDRQIEPHRAAFIKSTLEIWEKEYFENQAKEGK